MATPMPPGMESNYKDLMAFQSLLGPLKNEMNGDMSKHKGHAYVFKLQN